MRAAARSMRSSAVPLPQPLLAVLPSVTAADRSADAAKPMKMIDLPSPRTTGRLSLEELLGARRSVREFSTEPLRLEALSQLLWAAQGIADPRGFRTAPSAGALYPLEVYVVVGRLHGLEAGVYRYSPCRHGLALVRAKDLRGVLAAAALGQEPIETAPLSLVIAAVPARTRRKYHDRGERYVHIEAGHAAQNVLLQALALGLGAVVVGAFDDDDVGKVLQLPPGEIPLCILPIGRP